MKDYKFWKVEWNRNGMVGISDGDSHIEFTEDEWNHIRLEQEFEREENGGYPND